MGLMQDFQSNQGLIDNSELVVRNDQEQVGEYSSNMSDMDYENQEDFSEALSNLSIEDISTFEGNEVLEVSFSPSPID